MRWMLLSSLGLTLAACVPDGAEQPAVGMANPASVYCAKLGGKSEIRTTPEGQAGWCHLPDGTVIDEWDLYRRDHKG